MKPLKMAGVCFICKTPVEALYLDSGRWKCFRCTNPQETKEVSKSSIERHQIKGIGSEAQP